MNPFDITWNLPLADGYNIEAQYWRAQGFEVRSIGFERPRQSKVNRLRG